MNVPQIDHLVNIFQHAAAPAFLLGAIAAFMSLISSRASASIDRLRAIKSGAPPRSEGMQSADYVKILENRIRLLHSAVRLSLVAGISVTALLALLSAAEFFGFHHAYGAGMLFLVSNLFLGAALFRFAQETWIGLHGMDLS